MKFTPAFSGYVTPKRIGVYQRNYSSADYPAWWYAYWNGKRFGFGETTAALAASPEARAGHGLRNLDWRGLANKAMSARESIFTCTPDVPTTLQHAQAIADAGCWLVNKALDQADAHGIQHAARNLKK